jgi:hypothetical protein
MNEETLNEQPLPKNDGALALSILIGAAVIVVVLVIYLWRSKKIFASADNRYLKQSVYLFKFFWS